MPKYSSMTFTVRPVENRGRLSGYPVAGFLSKKQLAALRELIDTSEYERSKMWRGEYQEFAQAMVKAIDESA